MFARRILWKSEETFFPSFVGKMLMSAFLLRIKANYLEKMHGYTSFFVCVDSNSPCKDLLFPRDTSLAQVGTVLKVL